MSFIAYRHTSGKVFYCFQGDESRIPNYNNVDFKKLPPNPIVIQSTSVIMTEAPLLDCMVTVHELNELLTEEAAYERETKQYNEMSKLM